MKVNWKVKSCKGGGFVLMNHEYGHLLAQDLVHMYNPEEHGPRFFADYGYNPATEYGAMFFPTADAAKAHARNLGQGRKRQAPSRMAG